MMIDVCAGVQTDFELTEQLIIEFTTESNAQLYKNKSRVYALVIWSAQNNWSTAQRLDFTDQLTTLQPTTFARSKVRVDA